MTRAWEFFSEEDKEDEEEPKLFSSPPHLKSGQTESKAEDHVLRNRFRIAPDEVDVLLNDRGIAKTDRHALHSFLMSLVQPAAALARAPISSFHVGAVGLGLSGAIYVGVNVEFPKSHLNNSIHAEQFLLLNCLQHGERGLQVLAVSAAPCGHCRQFLVETTTADEARIVFGAEEDTPLPPPSGQARNPSASTSGRDREATGASNGARAKTYTSYGLNDLLPLKFGPMDLMSDDKAFPLLLAQQHHQVSVSSRSLKGLENYRKTITELLAHGIREAERWARQCYTPYTGCTSGVAIITSAGKVYSGGYVESAAFNPSLTPFHAAWAAAVTDHVSSAQVREVILVELSSAPVSQMHGVRDLATKLAPDASFTLLYLVRDETESMGMCSLN